MTQHLLLIEDEPKLREQLVELLQKNLFNVDACADGQDGLHMGLKYYYDIAVIDLGLPKISGIEVIERLRAEGKDYPVYRPGFAVLSQLQNSVAGSWRADNPIYLCCAGKYEALQ